MSATADLANHSDDVVIGKVARSILNERIDAAVVRLNGNRELRPEIFSYLDAAEDEINKTPLSSLGGIINTPGSFLTNEQIRQKIEAYLANKEDPAARAGVRVFKSGARTGLTYGLMTAVEDTWRTNDDGSQHYFTMQVKIEEDPDNPMEVSDSGDSGSLWIHRETMAIAALNHSGSTDPAINFAYGSRIEDVINELKIYFASRA